jgi:uncharacterized membrane protein
MDKSSLLGYGRVLFAAVLVTLGLRGLVFGDFASERHVGMEGLPGHEALAYVCAALAIAGGAGLLFTRTMSFASRFLVVFLPLWLVPLEIPIILKDPLAWDSYASAGEVCVILAGAWTIFALLGSREKPVLKRVTGSAGIQKARMLFGLAPIPAGIEHLLIAQHTAKFGPDWIPFHPFWTYLTGIGHITAGIGVLFAIWPRLATRLETINMAAITVCIWYPAVITTPTDASQWTTLLMSSLVTCGAWVVADTYRTTPWLAIRT